MRPLLVRVPDRIWPTPGQSESKAELGKGYRFSSATRARTPSRSAPMVVVSP